ncbi:MAG: UDP-N-acetylglucosamine 1-carboxyvinyltransferase [Clostridia bacterium]|nr:UDP-N-acetylglucosamine 1-carboxyvinyltransferase [Clostridia bacterium]
MKYLIEGGNRLSGSIPVSGSKNAVLPILAATIITGKKTILHNCPDISDVRCTIDILRHLGYGVERQNDTLIVDSTCEGTPQVPPELMRKLRSSIIFLGAFINRFGSAKISYPGGCELGKRPIDIHLAVLSEMGVQIQEDAQHILCDAPRLKGGEYRLSFPSVGATENVMIASLIADCPVTVKNPAKEPEIVELQNFLNAAGANILGAGTDTIQIIPQKTFHDCEYTVCSDRIEAATYMFSAAATGSVLTLTNAPLRDLNRITATLEEMGVYIITKRPDTLTVIPPKRLKPLNLIATMPHPGFPTDAQAILMASLLKADGTSMIVENIFENRYNHVSEFLKMGAEISVSGNTATIRGVNHLQGTTVYAKDLRAGAALVIAALSARGTTVIHDVHHISRGYENMIGKLQAVGAKARIVSDTEPNTMEFRQILPNETTFHSLTQ